MDVIEIDYNPKFISHLIPSLNWEGLKIASSAIGLSGFPDSFSENLLLDEAFLKAMHNLLLEIEVQKGILICPDTKKQFLIVDGIPNMKYGFLNIQDHFQLLVTSNLYLYIFLGFQKTKYSRGAI